MTAPPLHGVLVGRGSGPKINFWANGVGTPYGAEAVAFFELTLTATAPANVGIRVEAMASGETTRRATIPVKFA
jgi:hypothetical protein